MLKYIAIILTLSIGLVFTNSEAAEAKQCIYNDSATVLKVTWYNANAHKDDGASNDSLSFGNQACQDNSNLGFAQIECSGCIWGEVAAKTAVVAGGAGAFGVCVVASGGPCASQIQTFAAGTAAAVQAIPPAFNGKLVVVPNKGKTVKIGGNAFGLQAE